MSARRPRWALAMGLYLLGIFMGFVLGSLAGVALMVGKGADRRTALPFGPFLAGAGLTVMLAGPARVLGWIGWA